MKVYIYNPFSKIYIFSRNKKVSGSVPQGKEVKMYWSSHISGSSSWDANKNAEYFQPHP